MTDAPPARLQDPSRASGEPSFSAADLRAISALVRSEAGILLPPGKATLVYSRLAKHVRRNGHASFGEYIEQVQVDPRERVLMIEALTTNHTGFFREPHHFEHLASEVRAELLRRAGDGEAVRIWSAAASSGEEVFSIATTMLGTDGAADAALTTGALLLLASDINERVLATGRAGEYAMNTVSPMPTALRARWTRAAGERVEMAPKVRQLIRFRRLNLLEEWPFRGLFDVIFCRNVMIYFDEETNAQLTARFAQQLRPGGYLYIGHSERVTGPAASMLKSVGHTIFRKVAS
jgi:chemotaxis protein methyltransferase CheR